MAQTPLLLPEMFFMGGFKYFLSQQGLWDHPQFAILIYLLLGVLTKPLL